MINNLDEILSGIKARRAVLGKDDLDMSSDGDNATTSSTAAPRSSVSRRLGNRLETAANRNKSYCAMVERYRDVVSSGTADAWTSERLAGELAQYDKAVELTHTEALQAELMLFSIVLAVPLPVEQFTHMLGVIQNQIKLHAIYERHQYDAYNHADYVHGANAAHCSRRLRRALPSFTEQLVTSILYYCNTSPTSDTASECPSHTSSVSSSASAVHTLQSPLLSNDDGNYVSTSSPVTMATTLEELVETLVNRDPTTVDKHETTSKRVRPVAALVRALRDTAELWEAVLRYCDTEFVVRLGTECVAKRQWADLASVLSLIHRTKRIAEGVLFDDEEFAFWVLLRDAAATDAAAYAVFLEFTTVHSAHLKRHCDGLVFVLCSVGELHVEAAARDRRCPTVNFDICKTDEERGAVAHYYTEYLRHVPPGSVIASNLLSSSPTTRSSATTSLGWTTGIGEGDLSRILNFVLQYGTDDFVPPDCVSAKMAMRLYTEIRMMHAASCETYPPSAVPAAVFDPKGKPTEQSKARAEQERRKCRLQQAAEALLEHAMQKADTDQSEMQGFLLQLPSVLSTNASRLMEAGLPSLLCRVFNDAEAVGVWLGANVLMSAAGCGHTLPLFSNAVLHSFLDAIMRFEDEVNFKVQPAEIVGGGGYGNLWQRSRHHDVGIASPIGFCRHRGRLVTAVECVASLIKEIDNDRRAVIRILRFCQCLPCTTELPLYQEIAAKYYCDADVQNAIPSPREHILNGRHSYAPDAVRCSVALSATAFASTLLLPAEVCGIVAEYALGQSATMNATQQSPKAIIQSTSPLHLASDMERNRQLKLLAMQHLSSVHSDYSEEYADDSFGEEFYDPDMY